MRSHFHKIYQQASYLHLQKCICLFLLLKYAKNLQEFFGANGARLVDSDGNVLNIPQGALTGSAPVEVKTIASSAITGVIVTFSEAVDKNTVTSSNIYLKDSSGNTINGVFSVNPDGTEVTLYPAELLKSEASYTVTVTKSIRDLQGYLMGQDASKWCQFRVNGVSSEIRYKLPYVTGVFY